MRVGESATFLATDLIATAGDTYVWDFGDGTSGDGVAVQHTYWNPGIYTVSLTVLSAGAVVHTSGLDLEVGGGIAQARAVR